MCAYLGYVWASAGGIRELAQCNPKGSYNGDLGGSKSAKREAITEAEVSDGLGKGRKGPRAKESRGHRLSFVSFRKSAASLIILDSKTTGEHCFHPPRSW